MFYLDTSFAVSTFSIEPRTDDCQRWLGNNVDANLLISDWVGTEFASAAALKVRTGAVTLVERAAIMTRWRKAAANSFTLVEIVSAHFEIAAQMASLHQLSLRAGDALHIAVAQSAGAKLITLDKRMAVAALELGVPVVDIMA
jgi:uncharacterized protein